MKKLLTVLFVLWAAGQSGSVLLASAESGEWVVSPDFQEELDLYDAQEQAIAATDHALYEWIREQVAKVIAMDRLELRKQRMQTLIQTLRDKVAQALQAQAAAANQEIAQQRPTPGRLGAARLDVFQGSRFPVSTKKSPPPPIKPRLKSSPNQLSSPTQKRVGPPVPPKNRDVEVHFLSESPQSIAVLIDDSQPEQVENGKKEEAVPAVVLSESRMSSGTLDIPFDPTEGQVIEEDIPYDPTDGEVIEQDISDDLINRASPEFSQEPGVLEGVPLEEENPAAQEAQEVITRFKGLVQRIIASKRAEAASQALRADEDRASASLEEEMENRSLNELLQKASKDIRKDLGSSLASAAGTSESPQKPSGVVEEALRFGFALLMAQIGGYGAIFQNDMEVELKQQKVVEENFSFGTWNQLVLDEQERLEKIIKKFAAQWVEKALYNSASPEQKRVKLTDDEKESLANRITRLCTE